MNTENKKITIKISNQMAEKSLRYLRASLNWINIYNNLNTQDNKINKDTIVGLKMLDDLLSNEFMNNPENQNLSLEISKEVAEFVSTNLKFTIDWINTYNQIKLSNKKIDHNTILFFDIINRLISRELN
jgi:hypothetical protein